MGYIIFRGTSSADLGVVIEEMPGVHRPKRNTQDVQIPGREGRLALDLGSYDFYSIAVKLNCFGVPLDTVYTWLQGEGWLTLSDAPARRTWANVHYQIKNSRFRCGDCYDTLTVTFYCQPYWYEISPETLTITDPGTFAGGGNVAAEPCIAIHGSGDISVLVNGSSVLIDDLSDPVTLDCEARVAYSTAADGGIALATKRTTLVGGWPALKTAGEINLINWSGNVEQVEITPNWRWEAI